MNPADDRFLKAALSEDGMPISAGTPLSAAPTEAERERFASALADAEQRFIAAALAEDGMPITAGYVPVDRPSSPESDQPRGLSEEGERPQQSVQVWVKVVLAEIQNLPTEYRAPVSAVVSALHEALHEGERIKTLSLAEPLGIPGAIFYDRLGRGLTLLGERLRNLPEVRHDVANPG